jgi:hypothetical protein
LLFPDNSHCAFQHYDNEYGIAMQAMTANLDNPFELTDERADQAMEQPAVPHASGATQEATSSSADQGQKEQQQKKSKLEDPRTPEEEDYNKLRSAGTNVVLPGNMDGGPERVQLFTHCDPPSEKQQNTQKACGAGHSATGRGISTSSLRDA